MKKILILVAIVAVMLTGCFKSPEAVKGDLHIYSVDNKDGKITSKMIEEALASNGFTIGINSDINHGLVEKFGEDNFKVYSAISIYHDTLLKEMLENYADAGIFLPMGLAVYQRKNEDTLHISVVSADAQAKILGSDTVILKKLEDAIAKVITSTLPKATHAYSTASLAETRTLLTKYSMDLKGADFEDARETLEENFEDKFAEAGFVMPSYFDLGGKLGDASPYDFYITYSICKIDVIRAVAKVKPEAAAFAPCTTMLYKKKDEDKIVMGFTAVYNWLSSAAIVDKDSKEALMEAQTVFEGILQDVTK